MKRFLFLIILVTPLAAFSSNKSGFIGLSLGPKFSPNLVVQEDVSAYLYIGKKIQSQETYFGSVSLGMTFPNFDINYSYSFLRTQNWSLGLTLSFLIGTTNQWREAGNDDYKLVMGTGGRIGSYTRLKISRSFDMGIEVGGMISGFHPLAYGYHPKSVVRSGVVIYTNIGVRRYF